MLKCFLNSTKSTWPCFLQNQNCQNKNKNWTCIHELKCFLAFKRIKESDEDKNEFFRKLVKELSKDRIFTGIGRKTEKISIEQSRISSIKQKIYNINYLSGREIRELGSRSNKSKTTEKIFNKYKNWTKEQLEQKITFFYVEVNIP